MAESGPLGTSRNACPQSSSKFTRVRDFVRVMYAFLSGVCWVKATTLMVCSPRFAYGTIQSAGL